MRFEPLTSAEIEVIRCLFFRGLTWDGYLPTRDCCTSLRDRGLAQYQFGFAWLTPDGVQIAVHELGLSRRETAEQTSRTEHSPVRGPAAQARRPAAAILR